MPTVRLKATKMSDAKVSFISLVERGANRIPFKIVKKEKDMSGKSGFAGLDLSNLFARKSEKENQTDKVEVVGVVTMKGEGFDKVKEQIEESGFKVDEATEMEDGSVVFKQAEGAVQGEGEVIRINEQIALITKGFHPYMMNLDIGDQTFEQICKAQGFYPGVGTVMDVLRSSVIQTVEKAEDPSEASATVLKMFDEARTYVSQMVGALPAAAFKTESIYESYGSPAICKEDVTKDGAGVVVVDAATEADAKKDEVVVVDPAKDAPAVVVKVETCKECGGVATKKGVSVKEDSEACVCGVDLTESEIEVGIEKAALSAAEKTYAAGLKGAAKFAFYRMAPAARATAMGGAADGGKDDATETAAKAAKAEAAATVVADAAITAAVVEKNVAKEDTGLTKEQVSAIVASEVNGVVGTLTKTIEGMISGLSTTITKSISDVEAKVAQAEKVAKSASDAIAGIVVTGSETGDPDPVKKMERAGYIGREIDTAFLPRSQRAKR